MNKNNIRTIAIYLPQFHPIPENDEWWGKGFTEWRNVVKAKPRFKGHYQPQLPSDLGFYDLRLRESRQQQAELAIKYGISGFCYYHYWFNGKRILERPFNEVFETGKPDFPFMLCWANENWTRVWDGGTSDILLEQKYSEEDDIAHINYLLPFFKDNRYIKVDGKPVFIIYKDALFPDINRTIKTFRDEAAKQGIELYLCKFDRNTGTRELIAENFKFDAAIEFQPLSRTLTQFLGSPKKQDTKFAKYFYIHSYLNYINKKDNIISYEKFVETDLQNSQENIGVKLFPGVCPSWDNSSRRTTGSATIFHGSTPDIFMKWVKGKVKKFKPYSPDENFLFVNAWNEWAEGNHLEPCERWGHQYLEALKEGIS